jgi:predicted glycoside hydrolase/deacetylase ChbG (UPF0249 family)
MSRSGGLLIVNADDLGRSPRESDAIVRCWSAGGISSATQMVFMADSERAAGLAREAGLPTGLHLNLVEPYSAPDVPDEVRARQAALARHYGGGRARIRPHLYDPRLRGQVDRVIADQLARYRELNGGDPTHVDGHHHSHLIPTALMSSALPRGVRGRRAFTFLSGERPAPSRALRGARNALIARRLHTTDWLFDLRELHPALGGTRLEEKLALARSATVEVMAHPGVRDECELLAGDDWRQALAGVPLGSFAALA